MASGLLRPELLLSRVSGAPLQPLRPFDPLSGVNPLTALRAPQIGCYGSDETSSREQDEKARRVPISRPATPAASPRAPATSRHRGAALHEPNTYGLSADGPLLQGNTRS